MRPILLAVVLIPVILAGTLHAEPLTVRTHSGTGAIDLLGGDDHRQVLVMEGEHRDRTHFTLLEMLVVLVIIGLLAGLVGPKLFSRLDASKVQTAEAQVKMLRSTVEMLRLDIGRLPTPQEGLGLLENAPTNEPRSEEPRWSW